MELARRLEKKNPEVACVSQRNAPCGRTGHAGYSVEERVVGTVRRSDPQLGLPQDQELADASPRLDKLGPLERTGGGLSARFSSA
jgi:hypothetical protein